MQLISPKALNGLRKIGVLSLISIAAIIIVLRYSHWWCFWTGQQNSTPKPIRPQHSYQEDIKVGQIESNCGVRETCSDGSFPVFLSTGHSDDLWPQLCVSGKYIIQRGVNGGGRGMNGAVLEPAQFQVVSVRSFDTYTRDSAIEMDNWLEQICDNDILIVFTSDEASAKLNHSTRALLNSLGSGKIQDLSFRAQWFIITQKGGKGFSVYEKLSYPRNKSWGDDIDFRGCVPGKVPKQPVTIDPPLRDLQARDKFCEGKSDNIYQPICTQSRFQVLSPALLTNRSLIGNIAYSVPIYLFSGDDFEILVSALDSLIHQPGILLTSVTIVYNLNQKDVPDLAKLFNIKRVGISRKLSWGEMIEYSRKDAKKNFSNQKFLVVIDSETILSPDFLFYLAQTAPTLARDESISAVSAWSPNCYHSPGDVHVAYRVHGVPKFAALYRVNDTEGDIIAPDVSRVQGPEACHPPSLKADNWIERPQDLTRERYFHKLVMLQQRSQALNLSQVLHSCPSLAFIENSNYVVYYKDNETTYRRILDCLQVVDGRISNYQRIVRITVAAKASVMLINSNSSFYKARPIHVQTE